MSLRTWLPKPTIFDNLGDCVTLARFRYPLVSLAHWLFWLFLITLIRTLWLSHNCVHYLHLTIFQIMLLHQIKVLSDYTQKNQSINSICPILVSTHILDPVLLPKTYLSPKYVTSDGDRTTQLGTVQHRIRLCTFGYDSIRYFTGFNYFRTYSFWHCPIYSTTFYPKLVLVTVPVP